MRALSKSVITGVLVAAGCGGGGFGDEAPPVKGSVLGNGRSLASLNDPNNPRPAQNESVQATGVRVVFVDRFDETKSGSTGNIFLQDFTNPPGPYQGILAFQASFTPPSFRTSVGDVVDASGQYIEFQANVEFLKKDRPGWTTPEIVPNLQLRFDAPYVPLEPVEISIQDFLTYETGRPWLSMLVTARNVKLINNVTTDGNGRSFASMDVGSGVPITLVPTITNELFDLAAYAEQVKSERQISSLEGIEIESVTGIVTLFDRFHIAPRSADDIRLKLTLRRAPWLCVLLACLPVSGCTGTLPPASPAAPVVASAAPSLAPSPPVDWSFFPAPGRPGLAVLRRSGDGLASVALVVLGAGGPVAHTALAALLEVRLQAAGISAEGRGDRDGFRLVALGKDGAEIRRILQQLGELPLLPVTGADAAGLKLASARVAALRALSLEDPRLEDLAACAGDPAVASGTPLPRLEGAEGAALVESWRKNLQGPRAAFGVVGPEEVLQAARESSVALRAWPPGEPVASGAGPAGEQPIVYAEAGRGSGSFRVSLAAWFPGSGVATGVAARLGAVGAPVHGRLRQGHRSARLQRVVGVARRGGSCVLVSAEAEAAAAQVDEDAAQVSALLRQEVEALSREPGAVIPPEDPREAAVAGAWWSLARGEGLPGGAPRFRVALGVAPGAGTATGESPAPSSRRFEAALAEFQGQTGPAVELRASREQGQGKLWLLLASTCPISEAPGEHGITALTLLATLREAAEREGVLLEPWLTPEGAGVLASTSPRGAESAEATGERLAAVAGRMLLGEPPSPGAIQEARGALLGRLGRGEQLPGELWAALAPEQPGRLWVGGSLDGVARPGVDAVRQRWARLTSGPLRAALLVEDEGGQREAARRALERWILPARAPKSCSVAQLGSPGPGGATLGAGDRAYLAWRIDASGQGAGSAAISALLLGEPGRLLGSALEGSGVTGRGLVLGSGAEAGLVVELRGAKEALEGAIERSRGVMEKLGAQAEGEAWKRAVARWEELERGKSLAPRERVAALWRGEARRGSPGGEAWKRWVGEQLAPSRAVVLRPKQ